MQIAYWIVAALLAVFYLYAGGKKMMQSQEQLRPMMAWAGTSVPMPLVRLIGTLEVLGAAGLILPPLTGIASWLAVAAAAGLALLQVGAGALHLSRGEVREIGLNIALLVTAAVAAWLGTTWL
jgi:hypothetical protein